MGEPVLTDDRAPSAASAEAGLQRLLLWHEIETFNARYAAALDEQRLADWAQMFTDDALYVIVSRENFDRGLPVGLQIVGRRRGEAAVLRAAAAFETAQPWAAHVPAIVHRTR